MALYDIKPRFRQILNPLADRLAWLHPDAITLAGLGASGLAMLCFFGALHRHWLLLAVPCLLFIRIACNALDGLVAQRTGRARAFGEVLNEGVDRLSDVVLLLSLGFTPLASLSLAALTTVAVLLSSYAGILGKAVGVGREYGGILGKADRMFWMGLTAIIAWKIGPVHIRLADFEFRSAFDVMLAIFLPLAVVTTCQRIYRIRARLHPSGASR